MKSIFMILSCLALSASSGCASGRIHERSYLRAAAVSGADNSSVTFSFYDEGVISAQGEDIDSARSCAELKNGRAVFTGYTELLIVDGTDCCKLLEHMLNSWKVSPSCMVVYSSDGGKLLEEYSAEQLRGIAEQAVKKGISPECDVITVLGKLCTGQCAEVTELHSDGTAGSRIIY